MWRNWRDSLCVLTLGEEWRSLFRSLLPGPIVPGDGSRDTKVTIDTGYHQADMELLSRLGAVDSPRGAHELSLAQRDRYHSRCRTTYQDFCVRSVGSRPQGEYLNFDRGTTSGPLDVIADLSEKGRSLYTEALLQIPDTYRLWTMTHNTRDIYPPKAFNPPSEETLRTHGRIRTESGIQPFSDGLGDLPKSPSVTRQLLSHPMADAIRKLFSIPVRAIAYEEGLV